MENLSNIGVIREVMQRHGFTFSKSLGQNFLINPTVCPRMAEMGGAKPGVGVIEIGAGVGVLTAELSRRADKVVCIEIDTRLLPILDETLSGCGNVEIVNADVMQVDLKQLIAEKFAGLEVAVCANLPYYITSPILMGLLEQQLPIRSITVMVQKEAARRLCAMPGTRDVGAVSLAVRYYSEPHVLFQVSRGSFMPAPEVDSTVIRLDVRDTPPVDAGTPEAFFKVVRAAFSMRRKTVLNCLAGGLHIGKTEAAALLEEAGVAAGARAEQIPLEGFAAIARAWHKQSGGSGKEPF